MCKEFYSVRVCVRTFTLADDEAPPIPRATVPYPPLYQNPPFLAALGHFREAERRSTDATDLFQRGADRVVHNTGLFDSRRSSIQDDRPVDLAEAGPSGVGRDVEEPRRGTPENDQPLSPGRRGRQDYCLVFVGSM